MTYELWDLESRNLIDWFEERGEALAAVRAYLDADEANLVVLLADHEDSAPARSYSGEELIQWAEGDSGDVRRSA